MKISRSGVVSPSWVRAGILIFIALVVCWLGVFFYWSVPIVEAPLSREDLLRMNPSGAPIMVPLAEYFFIRRQIAEGRHIEKIRF